MRFLRSNELKGSNTSKWFSVDGESTGLLFIFLQGVSLYEARRPFYSRPVEIEFASWNTENLFQMIGPTGGNTRDGERHLWKMILRWAVLLEFSNQRAMKCV